MTWYPISNRDIKSITQLPQLASRRPRDRFNDYFHQIELIAKYDNYLSIELKHRYVREYWLQQLVYWPLDQVIVLGINIQNRLYSHYQSIIHIKKATLKCLYCKQVRCWLNLYIYTTRLPLYRWNSVQTHNYKPVLFIHSLNPNQLFNLNTCHF